MARTYAAKRDDNEKQIVKALEEMGCFVQKITQGKGVPDLIVGYKGYWALIEVKDGDKPKSQRSLTKDQMEWFFKVQNRAPVYVAEDAEQAVDIIKEVCRG